MTRIRRARKRFFTVVAVGFCALLTVELNAAETIRDSLFQNINKIRFENPDSAAQLLERYYLDFIEKQDTVHAIESLTILASVYGNQANYKGAYDQLWKALLLANQANLIKQKADIYRRIGRYYSFYKRREKAIEFFDLSLAIYKNLVEKGQLDKVSLTHIYSDYSFTYRELGEPQLAKTYLDSCFLFYADKEGVKKLPFLKMEQAFVQTDLGDFERAIQTIQTYIPWFEKNLPSYLVLVYSYLGDAYNGLEQPKLSEKNYQKAISLSKEYRSHVDFAILVHQKLSDLYQAQKDFPKAYEQLKIVQKWDQLSFDSRSENNRPLLEIQDAFRREMENKAQYLKEKRLAELEYENEVNFLQKTIISVLLVSFILFGVLYFYFLRNKHRAEKKLAKKERALEIQKNKELLEVKNKELVTFTLKLIEKDKFLQELKDKINNKNETMSLQEIKHSIKTATINNTENWTEFEARFIAVNKEFYNNLRNQFPNLTQGDRKLAALAKLKFTSKETARLMGISVESVHTIRYRLRKKLGVEKGGDLADFLAQF